MQFFFSAAGGSLRSRRADIGVMGFAPHEIRISLVAVLADIQTFDFLVQRNANADRHLEQVPRDGRSSEGKNPHSHNPGRLRRQKLYAAAEEKTVAGGVRADPI